MSASLSSHKLPSVIELKLRSVRWRHALLTIARTCAVGASVLISLMILAMAIDWALPFLDVTVRLALTIGTLGTAIAALVVVGVKPLQQALGWNRAASAVDHEIPELEERWSTVASLATRNPAEQSPLARAMAEQVTSEAVALEKIVHPNRVAPPVSPRPALLAAGGSACVLVVLVALMPSQMSVLLQRFWSPMANISATQLSSITGDQFVPRGDQVELVTELSGLPRSAATLLVIDADGNEQNYRLPASEDGPNQFLHKLRVNESLSYRVRSGDGQTEWHQLQVIDFPELAEVDFAIEFPAYTDREPVRRDRIPRSMKVIQGSTLTLALKPLEPLERLSLSLTRSESSQDSDDKPTGEHVQDLVADQDGWYRFRLPLLDDVLLQPTLWSSHGLKNQRRLFSRIEVIADKAPVARVISPSDEMAVAVDESIDIEFEAHDDHGIATAELVVYDEAQRDVDGNPKIVDIKQIPLGDQRMQKHVMGKTQLDLKELNLPEGSEISYAIRVTDNRNVPASDLQTPSSAMANKNDPERLDGAPASRTDQQPATDLADAAASAPTTDGQADESEQNPTAPDAAATQLAQENKSQTSRGQEPNENDPTGTGHEDATATGGSQDPADNVVKQVDPEQREPAGNALAAEMLKIPPATTETNSDASAEPVAKESSRADETADRAQPSSPEATSDKTKLADNDNSPPTPSDSQQAGMPPQEDAAEPTQSQSPAGETAQPRDDAVAANSPSRSPSAGPSPAGDTDPQASPKAQLADRPPAPDGQPNDSDPAVEPKRAGNAPNRPPSTANPNLASVDLPRTPNQIAQPPSKFALKQQRSRSGQNTLTSRRRLKITEKLASIAAADQRPGAERQIRENVVEIDKMLAGIETGLKQLVDHAIADADRGEQFRRLDQGLGNVESYVADLREETKENQFAFVGLQMVDIARTHVTPARDRVFSAIQRPNASDADATVSLQNIVRARELLGALLKRYDRVVQEKKLQQEIDETVTMYEVYLEKRRILMREARQNVNPLNRKMAVIEVDQKYLDRYAEVLKLRREMMEEFAQMLGDDPRLLSRYLELVKRRGKSLRDQLTELSQRQYEATEELLGWLQIDETQKPDFWMIIAELRLRTATDVAKDAAELAERIEKQLPLEVDADVGTPAVMIQQAKEIAAQARTVDFDAEKLIAAGGQVSDRSSLLGHARTLIAKLDQLSATLDRIQFEHDGKEAITDYLEPRMLEARTVADQAEAWFILCTSLADNSYAGLVQTEQLRLAVATQLLRVEMLEMETDLNGQFQQLADSDLPAEIRTMIRQLHRLMESITFNQAAASFRADVDNLESAAGQQELATQRFEEAEQLFDRIRRAVVTELDEYDVRDPNIADLRDPTLDEFLARLEREPNIAAQLGIPNRRRNLRVIADSMLWQQNGGSGLGGSGEAAAARAKAAMKMKRGQKKTEQPKQELSEEQQEKMAAAKQAQKMLEKSLIEIEKQRDDPNTPDAQRQRLEKLAKDVKQMLEQTELDDSDSQAWERIVQSDQAQALVAAIARGEVIPDEQWNKLMSTLDEGLWQVRGKQPPEAYRKAIEQYQDQIRELMQTIDEG